MQEAAGHTMNEVKPQMAPMNADKGAVQMARPGSCIPSAPSASSAAVFIHP
jgi:hypothetical protein